MATVVCILIHTLNINGLNAWTNIHRLVKWIQKKDPCIPAYKRPTSDLMTHTDWRLLRIPWTERRSNQSILKEISPEYSWKDCWWSWSPNTFATWYKKLNHRKRAWAGKDWRQYDKGKAQDKMVGWHHCLSGHEFEQVPGDGKGQESLTCIHGVAKIRTQLKDWITTSDWRLSFQANDNQKQADVKWGFPRWWRNRMVRPLCPPQIYQRSSACGATATKQLLNTGRGPQMPRKANQSLWNESWYYCKRRAESQRKEAQLQNFGSS